MANSTLDLPDPFDVPNGVSPDEVSRDVLSLGRAEDLLSQLAGDEIDRLMTESAPGLPSPVSRDAGRETSREITRLPAPAIEHEQEIVSVSPAELQALSAQLGSFFDAVDEGLLTPAIPGSYFDEHETNEEVTTELVRRAGRLDDEYRPAQQVRVALAAPLDVEPTPIYLKPFEWLANPIVTLSASARTAVGAMAVVSFLSAAGLLAYVLMLRNG